MGRHQSQRGSSRVSGHRSATWTKVGHAGGTRRPS